MRSALLIGISIAVVVLFLSQKPSTAIDDAAVLASAERVVEMWNQVLSRGLCIATYHVDRGSWYVRKLNFIKGSLAFDVRRTDSLVSPFVLKMTFQARYDENINSPNSNRYGIVGSGGGFKTFAEALANAKPYDFPYPGDQINIERLQYALQKDTWILKEETLGLGLNDASDLLLKANSHLTKDLMLIPMK